MDTYKPTAAGMPVPGLYRAVVEIENLVKSGTRKVNEIIVHCSATPAGRNVRCADIRRWHTTERGFTDIGYHFLVCLDGTVESGRPLDRPGAHCIGHNRKSIGICYAGGTDGLGNPADTRTPAQKRALAALISAITTRIGGLSIHGHRDFAPKACPCFDAAAEYSILNSCRSSG